MEIGGIYFKHNDYLYSAAELYSCFIGVFNRNNLYS